MKNRKIIISIVVFLLLIPFRLPVSIGIIEMFNYMATITKNNLPLGILSANIIVTKLVWDVALSGSFIYNIELISREIKGRAPMHTYSQEDPNSMYWWTVLILVSMVAYIIFDLVQSHSLFYYINS